jgi:hypothetical protein
MRTAIDNNDIFRAKVHHFVCDTELAVERACGDDKLAPRSVHDSLVWN